MHFKIRLLNTTYTLYMLKELLKTNKIKSYTFLAPHILPDSSNQLMQSDLLVSVGTDEDPSLRIESSTIKNLRGVFTKLNTHIVIVFTMQT